MGTKDEGLANVAPTVVHEKLLAFHVHIHIYIKTTNLWNLTKIKRLNYDY